MTDPDKDLDLQEMIDRGLVQQTENEEGDPTDPEVTDKDDPNYVEPGKDYLDDDVVENDSLGGKRLR